MRNLLREVKTVSFTPGLASNDPCANYWMQQVTTRLRMEICWCWHQRGILPASSSSSLPPFSDKVSEILNMNSFWEEKKAFFQTDPTAGYLSETLQIPPPKLSNFQQGSFSWVTRELDLDDISSFLLALGLVVSFDSAVVSRINIQPWGLFEKKLSSPPRNCSC